MNVTLDKRNLLILTDGEFSRIVNITSGDDCVIIQIPDGMTKQERLDYTLKIVEAYKRS